MLPDSLLESSTKIIYSIKSLSGEVKLYWSKYLSFSFPSFTQAQKRQKEILMASQPALTKEGVESAFHNINDQEKIWVLASLQLLIDFAAKIEDWISHREIILLHESLNSTDLNVAGKEKYLEINQSFQDFENRKVFLIDGSISIISFDFFLRWIVLIAGNSFEFDRVNMLLLNFWGVSIPILIVALWRSRADRKHNQALVEKIGFTDLFKIRFGYTGLQYSIAGFYLITGLLTAFLLIDNFPGDFAITIGLILYYLFLFNVFPIGRLTEYGLLQQIHSSENPSGLDSDSNDEAIVTIETELNSNTGRLEAYVLESALFGALAFSGFLQIIATDLITFPDLEKFASNSFHASQSLITASWVEFDKYAQLLNNEVSLFCLVSIETLICSALFLAVIASRLRFSDVADKVRTSLNLAKAYNEKEEQILLSESGEGSLSRLEAINERIYNYIVESRLHLRGVGPIVSYMVYFRNAGLLTFLTVLVTSSLFVSSFLGWSFIAIGVITVIYFNQKSIRSAFSSFGFHFQIFFAKYSRRLLVMTLLPGFLGVLFRVGLDWHHTDFLISLSYLLCGIYVYIWFVLMPHVDDQFGDIEYLQNEAWRSSGWRLIKNVYGVLILISFLGFGFKASSLNGANDTLLIGFGGLSLGSYFVGFYLTRPRWLGFLVAMLFGMSCIGTLFSILHFTGANEMNMVAFTLTPFFIVLFIIKRKSFHFILFRIAIVFFVLVFMFSPIFDGSLMRRLQMIYDHGTIHTEKIWDLHHRIQRVEFIGKIDATIFDESIKACDEYMAKYGNRSGYTEIYKQANGLYEGVASEILMAHSQNKSSTDSTSLVIAYRAASQVNKIHALFNIEWTIWYDIELEVDILTALRRMEEAKSYLNEAIAKSNDDEVVKAAKTKLETIEKSVKKTP